MTRPRFAQRTSQVSRSFLLALAVALAAIFIRGLGSATVAAAPLSAVPTDSVVVPAGGAAYLQVRGFALQPGNLPQGPLTLATPPLAADLVRTTLFYGVDWGYADSDPQQVALALWWAETGTWSDPNHSAAERITTAAASAPGAPSWNPDGRSLTQLAAEGQLSIAPLALTATSDTPAQGEGTLAITNNSGQDALVYLPYGTLFTASSGQILVWSVGVSQGPAQATVPAGAQPTDTATALPEGTTQAATSTVQATAVEDNSPTPGSDGQPVKRRQVTPTPSDPPPPKDSPTAEATDSPTPTATAMSTDTAEPTMTAPATLARPTATAPTAQQEAQPSVSTVDDSHSSTQPPDVAPAKRDNGLQGDSSGAGQAVAQAGVPSANGQNKNVETSLGETSASLPLVTPAVRTAANGASSASAAGNAAAPLPVGTQAPGVTPPQPPAPQQTAQIGQGTIPVPNSTAPAPVPTGQSKTSIPAITSVPTGSPTRTAIAKATFAVATATATVKGGGIAQTATATKVPAPTPAPIPPSAQVTKEAPPVIIVGPDSGNSLPSPPGATFPTANTGKGPAPSSAPITGAGPSFMPLWLSLSSAMMMLAGWGLRRVAPAKARKLSEVSQEEI